MQEVIIGHFMNLIKANQEQISEEKLAEIKYGLVSIYLLITKFIIIFLLAYLLGIIKEMLIFTIFYNLIRIPSFGLHATKSWICLVVSIIIFLGVPLISNNLVLSNNLKIIIGIVVTLFIFKNSPADTHKRPIISKKRRLFFKIISTTISVIFVIMSTVINNNFISNSLILALLIQSLFISPTVYKIFGLPYNNYKSYVVNNN